MKIAFNPSTVAALTSPPDNKDITFDLRGRNIFARGVKFYGTDTWRPVVDNLTSNSATSSLSANQGRVLAGLINGKSDSDHNHDGRYLKLTGGTLTGNLVGTSAMFSGRFYGNGDDEGIIIKPSSNGYAGLILGTHDGERSIFYFVKNKPFWRYSHGSDNLDIIHPKKSGTIALTSDIPSSVKNPYSLTTFGVVYDGSAEKVVSPSNFISQLEEGTSVVTDGTMFVTSWASDKGFADTNAVNIPYKRKAVHLWEYIKAKTDSLYATKNHNHDGRYVRTFGTSNDNIDSDWGESFKTFDPIPSGTPPEQSANISLLSIGNNFNRRKQLAFIYNNDNIYYRRRVDNGFSNWRRLAFANEIPTSLKNPHALTISLNGTSQGPYDGSAAKNINITPGSIGAAVSNHSHDYLVVNTADDKSFNSAYHNFQVLYAGGSNGITGKPANVDAFGLFRFRAASGWSGQMLLANGGSLYIRSSEDAKMTNTLAWKTILDSSNYSGILDSRYYTESEVNSLLSKKLDRVNLSVGSWNPRGYNLAADYYYNGGDLSISENGGKMYVSIDGQFYQNEGQYRVLDTSDVAGLKNDLTVHQFLSNTDGNWYPLIWGGSDHRNTNDSTGGVYKSYDKLCWQTSSQTLYATNIQTENIKHLSIGGGIYWNPNVESATDGSDAASITLVKSGVAGGTTLVLSQMNDANDTIQFKTNTAAKLYHNSYPILTTQNTYVSNHKGYINGTEITQVNNADTVDGWHKDNIQWTGYITSGDTLASYWFKMYDITVTRYPYNDITITFLVSEGYSSHFSIFYLRIRQNGAIDSGNYGLSISLYELVGNLRDKVVAYYNNSTGNVQLWGNTGGRWGTMNYTILKKTTRTDTDSSSLGTLTAQSFSSVQTPPSTGYSKVTMSRVGSVSYSDSTGSVHWNNITNKPSTFNPAAHTHTVFKNNLMIKGTNGVSDSASIHLGIGDSDTGFKWIFDGVCQIYANNVAIGQWTSEGMNWFKNPTVNGNKVWNAGNDGSGSGLDADTVDGEHANSFVRAGHFESANLNSLDTYSFIKSVNSNVAGASPNGNIGWYNVIQAVHRNGAADGPNYIGQIALGMTTNINGMFYRTKYNGSWYAWNEVVTTNTGLLRYSRNNVNISSPNCSPIPPSLLEWTVGYPRLHDPEFNEGYNNVQVYNNAGNGVVTVTRVHDTNVGNSSSYIMKVVSAAGATPNYGGWHVQTQTELGKVYTCLFRASIPSGVEIEWNSNSIGTGGQMSWLTNNMGTGKWTWYAVQVYCGSGGSTTFFFSAKSPCTWYLSYVNVIENNRASYAGLRSVYSDYLKANASIVFGRNELQYFNQYTGVTAGATNNANPKTDWYHILRMNHANNSGYFVDLAIPFFDNKIQFRRITNGSDNGWRRVITEEPNHDVILREASTDGNVGIGINNPAYKLDVNGQMRAEGFHHWTVNSDNYILLAGGGYKSFGGDDSNPIFLGYLNLDHGNDGTISSSFSCLGYSVPFTYTRGGNYCRIYIPDTTHQVFYIKAATASVHYSGGGMDTWTGVHRGSGTWWLHCYAEGTNEVRVKGFCQNNSNNDSWWGGNPLWSGNDGVNRITVCIFGYVKFR